MKKIKRDLNTTELYAEKGQDLKEIMKEIKNDPDLKDMNIKIVWDTDHIEAFLGDTPDDQLEQMDLITLSKIVEKRADIIKKMLKGETVKTKKPCFVEYEKVTPYISL